MSCATNFGLRNFFKDKIKQHIYLCNILKLSMDENGYYRPSKWSGKPTQVSEKSGKFEMDIERATCADPENSIGGGGGVVFIYVINVFHRGPYASLRVQLFLEGQLDPRGVGGVWDPIASRRGSVPDFLRKPITTCDFQVEWGGGGSGPPVPQLWIRTSMG